MFDGLLMRAALAAGPEPLPWLQQWTPVRSVTWAGSSFHALAVPDWNEIDRRRSVGLGAVTDYPTLKAVSALPLGVEIPWQLLDPIVAGYIAGLPPGLVDASGNGVISLLHPPFHRLILVKVTGHLHDMGSIGLLARDVPTVVVLRHRPRDPELALEWAEQCGLGLGYLRHGQVVDLVGPAEPPGDGLRRTRLLEVVFRRWLRQTAGTPANRSHAFSCLEAG